MTKTYQDAANPKPSMELRDLFSCHASEEEISINTPVHGIPNYQASQDGDIYTYKLRTREEARYAFADKMLKAREIES